MSFEQMQAVGHQRATAEASSLQELGWNMATARLVCCAKQLSSTYSVLGMLLAIKDMAPTTADTELPAQSSHVRITPELPCQNDQEERGQNSSERHLHRESASRGLSGRQQILL